MDIGAVRELEALAFRTWPARETQRIGSWDIGASDGFTRRANSAQALGKPGISLEETVKAVETWHRARGVAPCIKICPASPRELDAILEDRGWEVRTPATVMTLALTESVTTGIVLSSVAHLPSQAWLSLSAQWEGRSPCSAHHHAALLARIPRPGIVTLEEAGAPVALGVCALDGPDAFLYDLVVDPSKRGRGLGRALTLRMLDWAARQGATRAVLQVLDTNTVARRLYESSGYVEAYRYHYRQAPGSVGTDGC